MSHFKPLVRYHGGKAQLARWIVSHFPAHGAYCEPFGGGGSVLLAKPRATFREVYGDLDEEVVSLFRVVRDPALSLALAKQLRLTPYARAEFEASWEPSPDPVERARRTIVRAFFGFGSGSVTAASAGFRSGNRGQNGDAARTWGSYPDRLEAFCARLQGVCIERRDAFEVIAREDSPETLHYVDPPYLHETRVRASLGARNSRSHPGDAHARGYRYELSDGDHERLGTLLCGLSGKVVLSGYASPLYARLFADWRRVERPSRAGPGPKAWRTECLWLNPACAAALDAERSAQDTGLGLFASLEAAQ